MHAYTRTLSAEQLHRLKQAAREHKADAVGISGLLVKSTVIMRENLEEMTPMLMAAPVAWLTKSRY